MSVDATLLLVWAAVHAYAASFFFVLYLRMRRTSPDHLAFACLCSAFTVYNLGTALLRDAGTVADATRAVELQFVGAACASAFFVDFVAHVAERGRALPYAAYAAAMVAVGAVLSGATLDATHLARPDGALLEPELTTVGAVAMGLPASLGVAATLQLASRARTDVDARIILAGCAAGVAAGAHDLVVHALSLAPRYLLEHAGLLPVLAVSFVLLQRYVRTGRDLEQRTRELGARYEDLRETQAELVRNEQLAAVGELSAVIAHEVRNPLAVLKNAVSSLRRPTLASADRAVLFGILDEETDRLNRLVRDLLAYARPAPPKGASVEVAPLLERVVEIARASRRDQPRVEVDIVVSCASPHLQGDGELLRHALVNVVDNGLQAMGAGGRLSVRAADTTLGERAAIAISVADTGEGMDTLVRAKALDPFFTTRAAGTGLGLAIVDRVVRNHGGTLTIESLPGAGTTVTITLPRAG